MLLFSLPDFQRGLREFRATTAAPVFICTVFPGLGVRGWHEETRAEKAPDGTGVAPKSKDAFAIKM